VDDHAFVRDSLATMLASHGSIHVIGQVADVPHALFRIADSQPDAVIFDVRNVERGAQAAGQLLQGAPEAALIAMSLDGTWNCAGGMLDAGARGFVLKDKAFEELPRAIRIVTSGDVYVSPGVRRPPDVLGAVSDAIACNGPVAEMVCRVVELRDPFIARHQRRVAELSSAMVEELGLPEGEAAAVRHATRAPDERPPTTSGSSPNHSLRRASTTAVQAVSRCAAGGAERRPRTRYGCSTSATESPAARATSFASTRSLAEIPPPAPCPSTRAPRAEGASCS
jgi:CheY-like chemotaxis protein